MQIPEFLKNLATTSTQAQTWLQSLPSIIQKVEKAWHLKIGKPYEVNASCSYVAPCIAGGNQPAVLKIGLPHEEALHEIEGLRILQGNPTVKLFNFDKETNAMLLEKCVPGIHLKEKSEETQDEIICNLLREIREVNFNKADFRPLATMVKQWNTETYANLDQFPNPELAIEGCQLKEKLIDSTEVEVLLATDLHAGNVLKAQRKPWLVIDIKPYFGDPTYDLTQHILNCKERLISNPGKTIQRVAKLARVNPLRLKDWLFARLASENEGADQSMALRLRNPANF